MFRMDWSLVRSFLLFFLILIGSEVGAFSQYTVASNEVIQWGQAQSDRELYLDNITQMRIPTYINIINIGSSPYDLPIPLAGNLKFSWKSDKKLGFLRHIYLYNGNDFIREINGVENKWHHEEVINVDKPRIVFNYEMSGSKIWIAFPSDVNENPPLVNMIENATNNVTNATNVTYPVNATTPPVNVIENATNVTYPANATNFPALNTIYVGGYNDTDIINDINDAYLHNFKRVVIQNGTYYVNKSINLIKTLSIEGEFNNGTNIIANTSNLTGLIIASDNCNINNITLSGFELGIDATICSNLTIKNNIFNVKKGLFITGSNNIHVSNNNLSCEDNCIIMRTSEIGNICRNELLGKNGILITNCKNIAISGNDLTKIQNKGVIIDELSSLIRIYYDNLKANNIDWIRITKSESAQIDCNYWESLANGDNCTGICSHLCNIRCVNGQIVQDMHPYCHMDGWGDELVTC